MSEEAQKKFRFAHHVIDAELEGVYWGQTALADLDGDGRLEFILGRWKGGLYWYKCRPTIEHLDDIRRTRTFVRHRRMIRNFL